MIEIPSAEDFRKKVEAMEEKYGIVDCIYVKCTEEFSQHALTELNDLLKTRIIGPFLFDWGKTQRQLGYEGLKAVYETMKDRAFANRIEPLRKKSLEFIELADLKRQENLIVALFDSIAEVPFRSKAGEAKKAGSTVSSKVLHLCCPNLFVMWDERIRALYKKWLGDGEEYFEFLVDMKKLLKALGGPTKYLQKKYGKKATRIIDEYNWCQAHKE